MTTDCCGGGGCGPLTLPVPPPRGTPGWAFDVLVNPNEYADHLDRLRARQDEVAEAEARLTAELAEARAEMDRIDAETFGDPEQVAARFADPERRADAEQAIEDFLLALGVPLEPGHSDDTPARVAKAFRELLGGYAEDPRRHLHKQFPGPSDAGVVAVQGVRFTSLCAHHLLPFSGKATVAYLPGAGEPIVGLSKLARVVEGYARRMQTQEVLGSQVVDALEEVLAPLGAACIITSHHNCMGIRGVRQSDAVMTTSSLRGVFRDDTAARAELMSLHHAS